MSQKIAVIFTHKTQCSANKDNILNLSSKKRSVNICFPIFHLVYLDNRKLSTCM